jgi:hypothetical protein
VFIKININVSVYIIDKYVDYAGMNAGIGVSDIKRHFMFAEKTAVFCGTKYSFF